MRSCQWCGYLIFFCEQRSSESTFNGLLKRVSAIFYLHVYCVRFLPEINHKLNKLTGDTGVPIYLRQLFVFLVVMFVLHFRIENRASC